MSSQSRGLKTPRCSCLRLLQFALACCLLTLNCLAQEAPAPRQAPAPQQTPVLDQSPRTQPAPATETSSAPTPAPEQSAAAQQIPVPRERCEFRAPGQCALEIAKDQTGILTSPLHMQRKDLLWLAPIAAATGAAFAFDRKTLDHVSTNPATVNAFRQTSNVTGIYLPLATIGTTLFAGTVRHDDHLRETGMLGAEALIDTMLFTSFVKYGANRVRPQASGLSAESGEFWPDGKHLSGADSFPSGHSAIAFAFAHVVADEYPGWKIKLAVYSLAAATAAERVGGREHFPSDVLVGGTLGYFIGGYVYNHHSAFAKNRIQFAPIVGGKTLGISLFFSPSHDSRDTGPQ